MNVFSWVLVLSSSNVVTLSPIEPVNVFNWGVVIGSGIIVISPPPSSVIVVPSKFIVVTLLTDVGTFAPSIVVTPLIPDGIETPTLPAAPALTVAPVNVIVSTDVIVVEPSSTAKVAASIETPTSPEPLSVTVAPVKVMLSTLLTPPTFKLYPAGKEPLSTPSVSNLVLTLASV